MSDSSDSGQLSVPSDTDSADEFDGAQDRAVITMRSALAELHTLGDPAGATGTQLDDECQELSHVSEGNCNARLKQKRPDDQIVAC